MEVKPKEECCIKCGITYWFTHQYYEELLDCGNIFYCPKGHPQQYAAAEETKDKLQAAEARATDAQQQAECQKRSNSALRGVITKLKKTKSKKKN